MEIGDLRKRDTEFTDGEWVGSLPGCGDMRVKVRALQSPQALSTWGRLARAAPNDQREADGSLTVDAQADIDRQVLVEAVLLDWDGLTDNGEPVSFSKETAQEFVQVGLFEAAVRYAAAKVSNDLADKKESLSGNSATPSGGGSGRDKRRKKDGAT
jgi:hypothetical protein